MKLKTSKTFRKLTVCLGAALFSLGILLTPGAAQAGQNHHYNNHWHDNGNHYGNNHGYAPNPYYGHSNRDYVYHRGHYGYWNTNPSGLRIFINL